MIILEYIANKDGLMKNHFKSIRYKFIVSMTFVFFLFSMIVLSIWYTALKKEAESTAIANSEHLLMVSNTIFENQVKDVMNVAALTTVRSSNSLSTNIITILSRDNLSDAEIVNYRRTASDYLISLCSFKNNLNGLMLSDFEGNTITYGLPTSFQIMQDNGFLALIKSSDKKFVLIPPHFPDYRYNTDKDLVFSILGPVFDFSGNKIGFVNADINASLFQECFDTSSSSLSSLYVMNQEDETVLFRPANDILSKEFDENAVQTICTQLNDASGHFFIRNNKQEKMLVVYHTSALTKWTSLHMIPENDIVSAFTKTLHNIIFITAILGMVLILCVFFITSLLTRKIRLLANAVQLIDADYLEFTLEINSKDEIGALSKQFKAMLERINQLLSEVKQEEAAKHRAELSALQFQMNPHFLYNTLNTIQFLSSLQGATNIKNVATSLSSLMHINMDGRSFISIKEDGNFIKSYLEIQNYRYTNTFDYYIQMDEEVSLLMIPKLLVQPLVENALKHGFKEKPLGGILRVKYFLDEDHIKIIVEDNGCGITDERIHEIRTINQSENAGHIGIHNIKERMQMYFGPDFELEIISQLGVFTRFEITYPTITKEEVARYV